jgi:uncharacterized membrane protein YdjX (TVP38/TMEM64 family)
MSLPESDADYLKPDNSSPDRSQPNPAGSRAGRLLWVALVLAIAIAAAVLQADSVVSYKTLGLNYSAILAWVNANPIAAIAAYAALYLTVAMLFLPGSSLFVPAAGLLFGAWIGPFVAWFASMLAATAAYGVARFFAMRILPDHWPLLARLRSGFKRRAFGTMLFLRLTPGLSFAMCNAAPAALAVPFRTYFLGSAIGLIPSRIALAMAGAGMGTVIEAENTKYSACLAANLGREAACPYSIAAASLLTPETAAALVALAILALLPLLLDGLPSAQRPPDRSPVDRLPNGTPGSTDDVEEKPARRP